MGQEEDEVSALYVFYDTKVTWLGCPGFRVSGTVTLARVEGHAAPSCCSMSVLWCFVEADSHTALSFLTASLSPLSLPSPSSLLPSFTHFQVVHVEESVDPIRDLDIIQSELCKKDMEFVLKAEADEIR